MFRDVVRKKQKLGHQECIEILKKRKKRSSVRCRR